MANRNDVVRRQVQVPDWTVIKAGSVAYLNHVKQWVRENPVQACAVALSTLAVVTAVRRSFRKRCCNQKQRARDSINKRCRDSICCPNNVPVHASQSLKRKTSNKETTSSCNTSTCASRANSRTCFPEQKPKTVQAATSTGQILVRRPEEKNLCTMKPSSFRPPFYYCDQQQLQQCHEVTALQALETGLARLRDKLATSGRIVSEQLDTAEEKQAFALLSTLLDTPQVIECPAEIARVSRKFVTVTSQEGCLDPWLDSGLTPDVGDCLWSRCDLNSTTTTTMPSYCVGLRQESNFDAGFAMYNPTKKDLKPSYQDEDFVLGPKGDCSRTSTNFESASGVNSGSRSAVLIQRPCHQLQRKTGWKSPQCRTFHTTESDSFLEMCKNPGNRRKGVSSMSKTVLQHPQRSNSESFRSTAPDYLRFGSFERPFEALCRAVNTKKRHSTVWSCDDEIVSSSSSTSNCITDDDDDVTPVCESGSFLGLNNNHDRDDILAFRDYEYGMKRENDVPLGAIVSIPRIKCAQYQPSRTGSLCVSSVSCSVQESVAQQRKGDNDDDTCSSVATDLDDDDGGGADDHVATGNKWQIRTQNVAQNSAFHGDEMASNSSSHSNHQILHSVSSSSVSDHLCPHPTENTSTSKTTSHTSPDFVASYGGPQQEKLSFCLPVRGPHHHHHDQNHDQKVSTDESITWFETEAVQPFCNDQEHKSPLSLIMRGLAAPFVPHPIVDQDEDAEDLIDVMHTYSDCHGQHWMGNEDPLVQGNQEKSSLSNNNNGRSNKGDVIGAHTRWAAGQDASPLPTMSPAVMAASAPLLLTSDDDPTRGAAPAALRCLRRACSWLKGAQSRPDVAPRLRGLGAASAETVASCAWHVPFDGAEALLDALLRFFIEPEEGDATASDAEWLTTFGWKGRGFKTCSRCCFQSFDSGELLIPMLRVSAWSREGFAQKTFGLEEWVASRFLQSGLTYKCPRRRGRFCRTPHEWRLVFKAERAPTVAVLSVVKDRASVFRIPAEFFAPEVVGFRSPRRVHYSLLALMFEHYQGTSDDCVAVSCIRDGTGDGSSWTCRCADKSWTAVNPDGCWLATPPISRVILFYGSEPRTKDMFHEFYSRSRT